MFFTRLKSFSVKIFTVPGAGRQHPQKTTRPPQITPPVPELLGGLVFGVLLNRLRGVLFLEGSYFGGVDLAHLGLLWGSLAAPPPASTSCPQVAAVHRTTGKRANTPEGASGEFMNMGSLTKYRDFVHLRRCTVLKPTFTKNTQSPPGFLYILNQCPESQGNHCASLQQAAKYCL